MNGYILREQIYIFLILAVDFHNFRNSNQKNVPLSLEFLDSSLLMFSKFLNNKIAVNPLPPKSVIWHSSVAVPNSRVAYGTVVVTKF